MRTTRDLKLLLCIAEEATRKRFQGLLEDLIRGDTLVAHVPGYHFEIAGCDTRNQATEGVRRHLDNESHAAILVFDIRNPQEASDWGEEVRGPIKANCGTIAIMAPPTRLQDIDRVIGPATDAATLWEVLKLVTERLTYTSSPIRRTSSPLAIEVRLIRKQRELMDYFKLRHRIYKIMGYLNEEIETTPSQMEIDWCDTTALHIGAYVGSGEQKDYLVGTARVVVSSAEARKKQAMLSGYREWVSTLVEADPVLKQSLSRGVLPLELPIFQSQRLYDILREALRRQEVCGELSRVIVAEDYRGAGVSRRLVEFALSEATKVGVQRMFLECLALHESLYGKFGFQRIPGARGNVDIVNQTMIGMELSRPAGHAGAGMGG